MATKNDLSLFLSSGQRNSSWYDHLAPAYKQEVDALFKRRTTLSSVDREKAFREIEKRQREATGFGTPPAQRTPQQAQAAAAVPQPTSTGAQPSAPSGAPQAGGPGFSAAANAPTENPFTLLGPQYELEGFRRFTVRTVNAPDYLPGGFARANELTGAVSTGTIQRAEESSVADYFQWLQSATPGQVAHLQDRLELAGLLGSNANFPGIGAEYKRGDPDPATRTAISWAIGRAIEQNISLDDALDEMAKQQAAQLVRDKRDEERRRREERNRQLQETAPKFQPIDDESLKAVADSFATEAIGRKFRNDKEYKRFSEAYRKLEHQIFNQQYAAHFGRKTDQTTAEGMQESLTQSVVEQTGLQQEAFGNRLGAVAAAMAKAVS